MKHLVFSLSTLAILFSCKNGESSINEEAKISSENLPVPANNELRYKIQLPDTVHLNNSYKATIKFESDFDTIMPPVQVDASDSTKVRLITFYHYEPIKYPMLPEGYMALKDSTFIVNKSFDVDNIVFKEKGEFVFYGRIRDLIMYNHYNEKGIRDTVHFEERKQDILKKVVVVD